MMPMYGLDFNDMTKSLDTVQATEYRNSSCMSDLPMWFSYFKNLKNKPFWVVETAASWGGGVIRAWRNEPEFCTANSWLPVAMGADAIMYWLWRAHHSGHELMHGSVITPWGRPSHVFPEIQEVSKDLKRPAKF